MVYCLDSGVHHKSNERFSEVDIPDDPILSRPRRFLYGMIGSIVPSILELLFVNHSFFTESSHEDVIMVLSRIIVFAVIGGLVCTFLTKRTCSRQVCFMSGLCMAVIFSVLIR
ncbi:hypothetical protein [Endozoicomonas montiporae]|uniref:hypothetical protein n=1 Tax=Endozoicomonas montiporae TaxID=1027273 RepID=UPI0012685ABF|nr:hypothetical protein [Endozoicomonas montiporae]